MVVSVLLAYASLFIWNFLPATLLPLGSELALIALVLVAMVGNFLGSCTIYRLARRAARVLVARPDTGSPSGATLGTPGAAALVGATAWRRSGRVCRRMPLPFSAFSFWVLLARACAHRAL